MIETSDKKYLWLLFLVLFPLYLTWTFDHSLWNPDETRDAGIAWEMATEGNYALPKLNGEAFLEKPPLYYWSCAAVYKLAGGKITAGLTRLPAALYGFLGLLFTFLIGRRLFSARAGFLAAAMLATSVQYFKTSHFALMDSSLAALITGSFYFYLIGSFIPFILFVILAFYAKGFVAVALAGLVMGTDMLIEKKSNQLALLTAGGAALFVLLVAPWVYGLWKSGGVEFLKVFFIHNNFSRFATEAMDHREPFYYYFGSFPADFLPWSILFIAGLVRFIKDKAWRALSYGERFISLWLLLMFCFLSLSKTKRSLYLMPAFPAAALLSAAWLEKYFKEKIRFVWGVFFVLVVLIVVGDIFFIKKLDRDKSFLPVIEAVNANGGGAAVAGYDFSEMERGVFSFYLGRVLPNFTKVDDLMNYLEIHHGEKVLLLFNRNKQGVLASALPSTMREVFSFRADKKTRAYLLYSN